MQKNLTILAGFSFVQPYKLVGIDETGTEYNYDLTNCTITSVAKPSVNSCKSYPFTVTITNAALGEFYIAMDAELTDTITESSLVYDIKIDNTGAGVIFRGAYGDIAVTKEITP